MNALKKIIDYKKMEIEERSKIIPIERIKDSQRLYSVRDFTSQLKKDGLQIIAEIKRRSPASGMINNISNPSKIAKSYAANGAACISILTDYHFFGGRLEFIQDVRSVIDIPILRKDFIITEYQIWESFYAGSDAVLLIADALGSSLCIDLYNLANHLGMHVLIETHSKENLQWINSFNPLLIGVNCRNLETMETDLSWFESVVGSLSKESIWVAESGISKSSDLEYISSLGFHSALVGTQLMRSKDPGIALRKLCKKLT